jgi:phosphomevalonate kinase
MDLSENSFKPNVLLIFSGKRKAGKDYVCNLLIDILQKNNKEFCITSISISAPLKEEYAKTNNLDYEKLMDSSAYKENFRIKMIE